MNQELLTQGKNKTNDNNIFFSKKNRKVINKSR